MNIFKKIFDFSDSKETITPKKTHPAKTVQPPADAKSFLSLGLREELCRAVSEEGYIAPTPIQEQAIPSILKGSDILGCAQTGTGKTAAFSLPLLQRLVEASGTSPQRKKIKALILTPTRELAIQVCQSFQVYGHYLSLRAAVIYGGVGQASQVKELKQGVDVLVATPGRLLDLKQQGFLDLNQVEILVLDEADRMLDMGFLPDVKKIISALPVARQNLLFSATMPPAINQLAMSLLKNPKRVEVAPVSTTAEKVTQSVYFVNKANKSALLLHLLQQPGFAKVLVFTRTKATANRVVRFLSSHEVMAAAIHGNKSQSARQRALADFRSHQGTSILVASDLAARGIDVDAITHVINYDLPEVAETYVHRIGRTGRAEASGEGLSFCSEDDRAYLADIQKLIRQEIPVIDNHPFPPTFPAVAGGPRPQRPQSMGRGSRSQRQGSNPQRSSQNQSRNQERNQSGSRHPEGGRTKPQARREAGQGSRNENNRDSKPSPRSSSRPDSGSNSRRPRPSRNET